MTRSDIAVSEGDIRVADAAACDLYNHLVRAGIQCGEIAKLQSNSRSRELESMCPSYACHGSLSPPMILGTAYPPGCRCDPIVPFFSVSFISVSIGRADRGAAWEFACDVARPS